MALVFDEWSGDWYDDGTGNDTAIDYGYSTNIKGTNYTQDKNGNWTYEDSGGNIVPISTAEVQKLFAANPPTDYTPGVLAKLNNLLKTNLTPADLAKMGIGAGALAGLAGLGGYSSKPTGYQGGIPTLTASQPMLTEPPPGRRPGSGGINYGTGVKYTDATGKVVSDTSTPIADLYKKATQEGTYNEWGDQYGKGLTGAGGNSDLAKQIAALNQQRIAQLAASTPSGIQKIASVPTATKTNVPVATNTGIANAVTNTAANTVTNNAPAASTPAGGGFTVGGGGPATDAQYAQMVAYKKQQDAAAQAKLDAFHIDPNSPFYKYVKDPSLIPHLYNESDADALKRVKQNAMEYAEQQAGRAAQDSTFPNTQFVVANGGIKDANGNIIEPGPDEISSVVTDANGVPRYMKKSEAAAENKAKQDYLMAHGNIIDTVHPWNIAATDDKIKAAQDALAKLSANPGTDPQATLQNFLKTTTFTPEQLAAASNGMWGVGDLGKLMAGNTNQPKPDVGGVDTIPKTKALQLSTHDLPNVYDPNSTENSTGNNTGSVNDIVKSVGLAGDTTPSQADLQAAHDAEVAKSMASGQFGGIQNQSTAAPAASSLADLAHNIYGRDLTADEQSVLSSKSADEAKSIMEQSMANWNASHPSTPQNNTSQPTAYAGDPANGAYVFAHGGLTNLDHGGFVIPADVVSHFGNGSSEAGLKLLEHRLGAEPIRGHGDGMSDSIPASIEGREKALVANEEAYVSPEMVRKLGDGDMDEGSRKLANMMERIRKARTGSKEQGKQINPNKFMPGGSVGYAQGGGIKSYATGDTIASQAAAGVTGTEQNLSNWAGPAMTQMLGQAQALANTPYQAYTGPLTAGASDLQNQAFNTAANLPMGGGMATDFAQQAGNFNYTPTTSSFNADFAQQYMNPYLQASLNPQLEEARRTADIQAQADKARATSAGAFGGGRQAIMASEGNRNLNSTLAGITGTGYNTAYDKAVAQFNADQNRQMAENQFGASNKLAALGAGIGGAATANQIGINNLNTQATLGTTQRGIESEGIAADKAQFEEARKDPYTKLQYLQSMFNGLPVTAQNYTMAQPNSLQAAAGGASTIGQLLKNLGYTVAG